MWGLDPNTGREVSASVLYNSTLGIYRLAVDTEITDVTLNATSVAINLGKHSTTLPTYSTNTACAIEANTKGIMYVHPHDGTTALDVANVDTTDKTTGLMIFGSDNTNAKYIPISAAGTTHAGAIALATQGIAGAVPLAVSVNETANAVGNPIFVQDIAGGSADSVEYINGTATASSASMSFAQALTGVQINNIGTQAFWINIGSTAVANQCTPIDPGVTYDEDRLSSIGTNTIRVINNGTNSTYTAAGFFKA